MRVRAAREARRLIRVSTRSDPSGPERVKTPPDRGSFGSHWGMAVMRYHPEVGARAVLTGMEGPDHTYDSPGGVLASLERMAASLTRTIF